MSRRLLEPCGWAGLALLAGLIPHASGADHPELTPRLRLEGIHWPGEDGRRIRVSVGIYLVDFARINLREDSFDMAGYLDTTWVDPTLALKPGEGRGKVRRFRPGQVWSPALEFVNAAEQVSSEREGDLYVADDGRATQRVRFSHKFQSELDLKRFPFDSQALRIIVAPFDPFAEDIEMVVDEKRVGKFSGASVTDWEIVGVAARAEQAPGEDPGDLRVLYEVTVRRHATFYVWRVLAPMTLLVVASWVVFWFEPANLQPQVSTDLAILLSLVTFTYAIDFSLPKVAYLTFIDRHTLTSLAFVLLAIFAVSAIHVIIRNKGVQGVARLQRGARWAFPLGFVVAVAANVAYTFR